MSNKAEPLDGRLVAGWKRHFGTLSALDRDGGALLREEFAE